MAKCFSCGKMTILSKNYNNITLCNNCASLINYSCWYKRNFSTIDELMENKERTLQLATSNNFKKELIDSLTSYFDEYINNGFISAIDGKAGQTITLFSDYCIINTKSDTAKTGLSNMFYQFDYNDEEDDEDEVLTVEDKLRLAKGFISGGIVKTGIDVAMSATLKSSAKEQKEEKRRRLRSKSLDKIIKVGDKKLFYKNYRGVETFSKTNTANGYLKFIPQGINSDDLYSCEYFFFNNSIPFETKKIKQKIEYAQNIINEKINSLNVKSIEAKVEIKEEVKEIDSFEEIRKYKQLLEEGIISEKEFNKKKKELLNL